MNNRYREEESLEQEGTKEENKEVDIDSTIEDIENDIEKIEQEGIHDPNIGRKKDKISKKDKHLQEELSKLQDQVKELNNKYLKVLAESENYRKRIEEEKIRDRKYASQRLLEKLINPIDIFDKACNMKTDNEVLRNFLIGFQMIDNQIHGVLEEEGVKKIKVEGKFDPRFMQAMEVDYDPSLEEDAIIAILKDGYMYKDRVLVPTMVKVNKKPVEDAKEENKESEEN